MRDAPREKRRCDGIGLRFWNIDRPDRPEGAKSAQQKVHRVSTYKILKCSNGKETSGRGEITAVPKNSTSIMVLFLHSGKIVDLSDIIRYIPAEA